MVTQPAIFIVDDDVGVRDLVRVLLELAGFPSIRTYESSRRFLDEASLQDGDCVLLDLRMPDPDGLAVLQELNRRGKRLAIIMITGHAAVPIAVRAMQAGAADFITKPFSNEGLIGSVHRALAVVRFDGGSAGSDDVLRRLDTLTAREREVFDCIVQGLPNKVTAHDLKISQRTVEMHRARVMVKMQAPNLGTLIRMAIDAGIPVRKHPIAAATAATGRPRRCQKGDYIVCLRRGQSSAESQSPYCSPNRRRLQSKVFSVSRWISQNRADAPRRVSGY